jgi:GntR family transcriptional regulator
MVDSATFGHEYLPRMALLVTPNALVGGGVRRPLHERVYRILLDEIERGHLPRGARLPPERILSEQLSVSRATLRRALQELADKGLIESWVGRGTFVTGGMLSDPPSTYRSFTELGAERGLTASSRVLVQTVRPALLDEADKFRIAPGADVFELERLRMLDGLPIAIDRARVPLAKAPNLTTLDYATASLFQALEAAGMAPVRGDYAVTAIAADDRQASLLGTPLGAPLLLASSTDYELQGSVIELSDTLYRGDRYRFRATLTRR